MLDLYMWGYHWLPGASTLLLVHHLDGHSMMAGGWAGVCAGEGAVTYLVARGARARVAAVTLSLGVVTIWGQLAGF